MEIEGRNGLAHYLCMSEGSLISVNGSVWGCGSEQASGPPGCTPADSSLSGTLLLLLCSSTECNYAGTGIYGLRSVRV